MKRQVINFVGLCLIVLTVIAGLAWYNNVKVLLQWNPLDSFETKYYGPISWLNWSVVDYSTVSTFVPFFGILLTMIGFFRISNAKKNSDAPEYFPFFKSYASVTVALGLIGTVWGIIMIGYYDPKTIQMSQLIKCLHTALYSTLIALLWVFLVVLPIRYVMQRLYRLVSNYKEANKIADISSSLKNLGSAAVNATSDLSSVRVELGKLKDQTSETKDELKEVEKILEAFRGKVGELSKKNEEALTKSILASEAWQKVAQECQQTAKKQQEVVQKISEGLDKERVKRERAEQELLKTKGEKNKALSQLQQVKAALSG